MRGTRWIDRRLSGPLIVAGLTCQILWSDEAPLATGPGQVQGTRLTLCETLYVQEIVMEQRICFELERKGSKEVTCSEWKPVWRGRLRHAVEPVQGL